MKAISKEAQSVLELLTEGLGGTADEERASRTIDNAHGTFMAVTVERVGAELYSVAHYYQQNGDRMRDPEVVFWRRPRDGRFCPVEWTHDGIGVGYQRLVEFDDSGKPAGIMVRQQRSCAVFCATWMVNIKKQQKLGRRRGRPGGFPHGGVPFPPAPSAPPVIDAREVPTALIDPNPDQPRKTFDEQALQDLASSIASSRLQQPIKVRPVDGGRFMIVCGERRWRAHVLLGLQTVPCIVEEMSVDDMEDAAIVENLQRADLAPLEEARAFQRRLDAGVSVEQLALRLGLKQPHRITERTCLLNLFPEYQEALARGDLKSSQAYELAQLSGDYQRALFNAIRDGKCRSYNALRAVAQAFRDAQTNAVPVLVVQNKGTQVDAFADSGPTESERVALTALERKILAVEKLLQDGLKDNEVVITAKVARANATVMAERLGLISRQLDKLRLALLAQSALAEAASS
jgi:ParB family chromosome partitioning protein